MPAARLINTTDARTTATIRIARYVNRRFGGNVSEAARALGCDYTHLWRVVRGRLRPNAALIVRLSMQTNRDARYWNGDL